MIHLRPATAADAAAVGVIYIESWNDGFGHLLGLRVHSGERVDQWRVDLESEENEWTIASIDGRVAGFIGIGPSRDPIDPELGELKTIAVAPDYWRGGIGRALTEHGVDQLRLRWQHAILWTPAGYDRRSSVLSRDGLERTGQQSSVRNRGRVRSESLISNRTHHDP